jgi:hypothetical protein
VPDVADEVERRYIVKAMVDAIAGLSDRSACPTSARCDSRPATSCAC